MAINVSIHPLWPVNSPKPATHVWYQWKQTFLPSITNAGPLTEAFKLKPLRLYLGELSQSFYDARHLNEQSA